MTWQVKDVMTDEVLCYATDRGHAESAAEWFRAAGAVCKIIFDLDYAVSGVLV